MLECIAPALVRLLRAKAPKSSSLASAGVDFEVPDSTWRQRLANDLTVNCYLYAIIENLQLRTTEPVRQRLGDGTVRHRGPPFRLDCTYAITAWSKAEEGTLAEHQLLSEVLWVLLRYREFPRDPAILGPGLIDQPLPYPTGIAGRDGAATRPEFWSALEQRPRPAIVYVVTLAMFTDEPPTATPTSLVDRVAIGGDQLDRPRDVGPPPGFDALTRSSI